MTAMFDDFKEQVRAQTNIVEVISEYVTLKKKGRSYWGCCPFHGEKTPSFSVTADKNFFYCYGCHIGGDVFTFIMKMENCSFIDALKLLAGKAGIAVPEQEKTKEEIEKEKRTKEIIAVNELATRFYQACLQKSEFGKIAQKYLTERGITPEIIEKFSIGVSLPGYTSLASALGKRGCKPELLVKAGLALNGHNGVYDKFRGRVMIPIADARGHIVGFGGRVIVKNAETAKYMNTAETDLFNKRTILFGFNISLDEIKKRRQAIIVEGYMDAISLHAAGVSNAVASMGTAFSVEQAKMLARVCDEIIFSYDSDEAGLRAAVRAVSIARSVGLAARVIVIPDAKDPDEYVRKYGTESYLQLVEKAAEGMDFQIRQTVLQNDVTNLAGKVKTVSNVLPFLLECKNDIEVAEHIKKVARLLTIDEGLIQSEFRKANPKAQIGGSVQAYQPSTWNLKPEDEAEQQLLHILAKNDMQRRMYIGTIETELFCSAARREIFETLKKEEVTEAELFRVLSQDAASEMARIMAKDLHPGEDQKLIDDCLRKMRRSRLEALYEKHRLQADEYERLGDKRFLQELAESQRIKNEIKKLY